MSDQYIPPRTTPPRATTTVPGADPYRTTAEPYRDPLNRDLPPPVTPSSPSGLGSGMLVAAVFVVVAIIAAAVFGNRDMFGGDAVDAPVVPAESTIAPAETTIDPVAPAPTAVDPAVTPDPAAPAPDAGTTQPAAPVNP